MTPIEFNDRQYQATWNELQAFLRPLPLSEALGWLFEQQLDVGFVRDDLRALRRYKFEAKGEQTYYLAQHNPARERRHEGAGRAAPPPGRHFVHGGCFLCPHNVYLQHGGLELGCEVAVGGRDYIAWPNPFPLGRNHFTVATVEHRDQPSDDLAEALDDLLALAERLDDGWLVLLNGTAAGASIPTHRHFQILQRTPGYTYAIEQAVAHADAPCVVGPGRERPYPLLAYYDTDALSGLSARANAWFAGWASGRELISNNLVAIRRHARTHLFIVPRHRSFGAAAGRAAIIGGLEVIGELVFSSAAEREMLDRQEIDAEYIRAILAGVRPPEA